MVRSLGPNTMRRYRNYEWRTSHKTGPERPKKVTVIGSASEPWWICTTLDMQLVCNMRRDVVQVAPGAPVIPLDNQRTPSATLTA